MSLEVSSLEEIYGYIPVNKNCYTVPTGDTDSRLPDEEISNLFALNFNYFYVTGKQIHRFENTETTDKIFSCDLDETMKDILVPAGRTYNVFNCIITYTAKYRAFKQTDGGTVPDTVYWESAETTQACKIIVNENYEIVQTFPHDFSCPYKYFANNTAYTQSTYETSSDSFLKFKLAVNCINLEEKTSIINVLVDSSSGDDLNNKILGLANDIMGDIGNNGIDALTDGSIKEETATYSDGSTELRWRWSGTKPLDKLIYIMQSQLDILYKNYGVGKDVLATTYASVFPQIIQIGLQYNSNLLGNKVQVITALSHLRESSYKNILQKVQSKWYYIQMQAFKSNNKQKLFAAQYEGASTAFSAGMTDYQPRINTDEELMTLYGEVSSQFLGL